MIPRSLEIWAFRLPRPTVRVAPTRARWTWRVAWGRRATVVVVLGLFEAALWGCSSKDQDRSEPAAADPAQPAAASAPAVKAEAPAASPKPPPAPEGSVLLEGPWLYVQTCAGPNPCPQRLQPGAAKHCDELSLGSLSWRLPSLEELRRFAGADGLEAKEGFHWTETLYEEDDKQVWILDPVGGQSTTIPRDRKPFTARCVATPEAPGGP